MTTTARPVPIRTDRLLLRAFELADGPARLAWQSRPDVARWLMRDPLDAVSVLVGIRRGQEGRLTDKDDRLLLAVARLDDGVLVGEVSARLDDVGSGQVEVGWVFDPEHSGRGYATEAAAALVEELFSRHGAHRVFARLLEGNDASERLCRRLGMRREAHLRENELWRGEWTSELVYARLASDPVPGGAAAGAATGAGVAGATTGAGAGESVADGRA